MDIAITVFFVILFVIIGMISNKQTEKEENTKQQEAINKALAKREAQQKIGKAESTLKERKKQLADKALTQISGAKAILRVEETACGQLFVTFVSHDNKKQQTVV
ncbi:MAG: hypothetical protein CMF12_13925 [Idiomarina sp.]|uniref:hypothetical protein n=1 Tax=Idiomarina sp. TaxID=1874361 RepID=UPI000C689682|nr:hypothetical protein [Idiomarina sp.]MBT43604.1 hypothetical protein [Idiomarina sp.]|tara:strand:+ start:203 stop:517 length:315 start_codon:yes stop_codon:yes gene_type:complete